MTNIYDLPIFKRRDAAEQLQTFPHWPFTGLLVVDLDRILDMGKWILF